MSVLRRVATVVVVVGCLCAPAAASAATLSWSGTISPSDPQSPATVFSSPTSTCSAVAPSSVSSASTYDAYALRNTGADDCVTVEILTAPCGRALGPATYLDTFAPTSPVSHLVGAHSGFACGSSSVAHQASIPAGRTFVPIVHSFGAVSTTTGYTLNVTGASLALAQEVNVTNGGLPKGNTLTIEASSLQNGGAPYGTVSVSATSGQHYSGPVTCVRVDGDRASLLMQITDGNAPARLKGAVYWMQETVGATGGQRNRMLTQVQLDAFGGVCPDPAAPPHGSFNPLTSGYVSAVDTPDADAPPET